MAGIAGDKKILTASQQKIGRDHLVDLGLLQWRQSDDDDDDDDDGSVLVLSKNIQSTDHYPLPAYSSESCPPLSAKIVTIGVSLDNSLTMNNHISNVCRSSYFHVRQALTDDMAKTVGASLIHTRIHYAYFLIHGSTNIKNNNMCKLQLLT